jgi:hypothetical protein
VEAYVNILPIACQYILSLMLFIVDNQKDFQTKAYVHRLDTRNKNHLYLSIVSLSCVQKRVPYSGGQNFYSIPSNIQTHRKDRKGIKTCYSDTLLFTTFIELLNFYNAR